MRITGISARGRRSADRGCVSAVVESANLKKGAIFGVGLRDSGDDAAVFEGALYSLPWLAMSLGICAGVRFAPRFRRC